jgi:hypothetical protein
MGQMDPYAVLGLPQGASPEAAAAAWRRLAKRWHPDRGGGENAAARMAEINAAYDLVRNGIALPSAPTPAPDDHPSADAQRRRPKPGAWLDDATRAALGPELLRVVEAEEQVRVVTPVATWASPQSHLVATDRRLLWLLDDAVTHRVRSLHYRAIEDVSVRLSWPRRRTASVRVKTKEGRRLSFSELRPSVAVAVVRHVRAGLVPGAR